MMPILSVGVSASEVAAEVIAPQEKKTSVAMAAIHPAMGGGFALEADWCRVIMVWIPPLVISRPNERLMLARHGECRWDHNARRNSPVKPVLFSKGYRAWLLTILLLTNALNLADRQGIAVVAQAIKLDLKLTDAQMGIIQGLGFAISIPCWACHSRAWPSA